MASILLQIARICNSQFKCNYLKNKKNFLNSCFHFWNLHEILNILEKKMIVIANVFPQLQNVKKLARTLSKEQRFRTGFWQSTCESGPNTCKILLTAHLSCFSIILREIDLENISRSFRWNLRGVSWHNDSWWQISCSRLQEFATPNSNAIIWKTKNFISIPCSISGIYIKF